MDETWRLRFAQRCAPAIRDYVTSVCGVGVPPGVTEAALLRIADGGGQSSTKGAAADFAREAAREAALAEVSRAARRARSRLRHVTRGRFGHAIVPDLLRRRAAGSISPRELARLYAIVERCPDCGELAARLDAAEWRLKLAAEKAAETFAADPSLTTPPLMVANEPAPADIDDQTAESVVPAVAAPRDRSRLLAGIAAAALVAGAGCDVAAYLIFDGARAGRSGAGQATRSSSVQPGPPRLIVPVQPAALDRVSVGDPHALVLG